MATKNSKKAADKKDVSENPPEEKKIEQQEDVPVSGQFTEVKNANASGMGSIGGNDDDLPAQSSGQTADDY